MKLFLVLLLATVLLSGVAYAEAKKCPGTSGAWADLNEYTNCELLKPINTVVGDLVTVSCVKNERIGGTWSSIPLQGTGLHVTGYDDNDEPLEEMWDSLSQGTYTFKPGVEGHYLVEVAGYNPLNFSVGYNPLLEVVEDNSITGAATVPEPQPEEQETVEPPVEEPQKKTSILDIVINCTDGIDDEAKEDVPGLMLMLVNFMIS